MGIFQKAKFLEVKAIIYCLTLIASIAGFYALAIFVSGDSAPQLDQKLLLALRSGGTVTDPIGPDWLEEAARDITALGSVTVLIVITLTVSCALFFADLKARAGILLFVTIFALAASSGLKQIIDRSRPDLVEHQTRVFTRSFPSAHAMNSSATYLTLAALLAGIAKRRRVKAVCLCTGAVLTLGIGISRTYLGVHWPTDVIAGWLGGIVIALGSVLLGLLLKESTDSP